MAEKKVLSLVKASLFEVIPAAVYVVNKMGVIVSANKYPFEKYGFKKDEVVGKRFTEVKYIDEETRKMMVEKFKQRITEGAEPYEMEFVTAKGEKRWCEIYGSKITDEKGNVEGILLIATDVSERHRIEGELRRFRVGIDNARDIIFMTDSEGKIFFVNKAFEDVYGYSEKEWRGQTPRILKSGEKTPEQYTDLWKKIKGGDTVSWTIKNKTKTGKVITVESMINPIIDESQRLLGFLAIQRDVTGQKDLEEDLRDKAVELEKMNKLMVGRELRMIELKKKLKEIKGVV